MAFDREINDLQFLKDNNQSVVKEFCLLAIQSIEEEVSSKTIISVAKKLNVNPIQIEWGLEGIVNIFFKAAERGYKGEDLTSKFGAEWLNEVVKTYSDNAEYIKDCLKKLSIKGLEYESTDWRLDILSQSKAVNNLSEPVVSLQLKLKNRGLNSEENLDLQIDPSTLVHVTQSLENALRESRSHQVRKFKEIKPAE